MDRGIKHVLLLLLLLLSPPPGRRSSRKNRLPRVPWARTSWTSILPDDPPGVVLAQLMDRRIRMRTNPAWCWSCRSFWRTEHTYSDVYICRGSAWARDVRQIVHRQIYRRPAASPMFDVRVAVNIGECPALPYFIVTAMLIVVVVVSAAGPIYILIIWQQYTVPTSSATVSNQRRRWRHEVADTMATWNR
jgi:hypothetical protein